MRKNYFIILLFISVITCHASLQNEEVKTFANSIDVDTQFKTALILFEKNKFDDAFYCFNLAAKQNHIEALFNASIMLSQGQGTVQDLNKSFDYCLLAANAGCREAQFNTGCKYDHAQGVERNLVKALEYYTLAAHQNHMHAQFNIASIYYNGDEEAGIQKDYTKALHYFKLSANQKFASAQFSLGYMYYYGDGVNQDFLIAFDYFNDAANQGHIEALYNMGMIYVRSMYAKEEYQGKALNYFSKAAKLGHEKSKKMIIKLSK
jgi:TPR repeat protein